MSFSSQIKDELYSKLPEARHCRIALLLSLERFSDETDERAQDFKNRLAKSLDYVYPKPEPSVLFQDCCKRSFLRGAFLAAGTLSDPEKSYDLEFVLSSEADAAQIVSLLQALSLTPKQTRRKKQYIVYLKDGDSIVELLGMIEAHKALLEMENVRVVKEVRGLVNRHVNCETANLSKTVDASVRQREAIRILQEKGALSRLSESLQEIAAARLQNPDVSLEELGALLDPPVGKSGVNHRMRRLMEAAERS